MPSPSGLSSIAGGLTWPALRAAISRHASKAILVSLLALPVVLLLSLRADAGFKEAAEAYESADVKKMLKLLEPLANNDDARAQSLLGTIYYSDVFVKEDIDRARRLFDKAAKHNDPEAQYNLGYMYSVGDLGAEDPEKAVAWFQKAAEQGHPAAQFELGLLYIEGEALPRSRSDAEKWLSAAAKQESKLAQAVLAQLDLFFHEPPEYPRITLLAIIGRLELMKPHGLAPTQAMLGTFYARGTGVDRDRTEALKWITLATFQMPEATEEARQKLASQMSPSEVREAERQAVEWLLSASKEPDTYIGQTAQWCYQNHPGSVECLKVANVHHEYCMAPYFLGFFENFTKSKAYNVCRESRFMALTRK